MFRLSGQLDNSDRLPIAQATRSSVLRIQVGRRQNRADLVERSESEYGREGKGEGKHSFVRSRLRGPTDRDRPSLRESM